MATFTTVSLRKAIRVSLLKRRPKKEKLRPNNWGRSVNSAAAKRWEPQPKSLNPEENSHPAVAILRRLGPIEVRHICDFFDYKLEIYPLKKKRKS